MTRGWLNLGAAALIAAGSAHAADPPKQDGQWRGRLGAGLNITQSTTDSLNVNLAGEAVRATAQDQWDFGAALLYGTSEDAAGVKTTSANLGRLDGRYAYNLSPKVFGFGSLGFNYDRLQDIDMRSVLAGGLGYHVINTPADRFDLLGGLTYNHTKYVAETVDAAELLLGEESSHKISEGTSVMQRLSVLPNLSETGEYRLQFTSGLSTKITDTLNLTVTLTDNYQTNPQPGIARNELLFITGISVSFGPK
jgi:putative salt-induced outer membrane protein YdiY